MIEKKSGWTLLSDDFWQYQDDCLGAPDDCK